MNVTNSKISAGGWNFNELNLELSGMYEEYFTNTTYPLNVFSWNFAFIWAESRRKKMTWRIVDDMLVTFRHLKNGDIDMWHLPVGAGELEKVVKVLHKCLNFCHQWNIRNSSYGVLRVINAPQLEYLSASEQFNNLFKATKRKGLEIVLSINKLLALTGTEFKPVRNKINKFKRNYPDAVIRRYEPSDFEDLMKVQKNWTETSGQKYRNTMDLITYPEILRNNKNLDHLILVVEIKGKVVGMISGGIAPTGCAWSYFIKAEQGFQGIYETMMIKLAQEINRLDHTIDLLNIGSDLGEEGLAKFKDKYRPAYKHKRYRLTVRT